MNFNDYLNEALKIKYVVRDKKRVKKYKTTRPGKYRVEYDANGKPREVRITAAEKRHRKIGQRKGKIKRAAKMNLIKLKQKKSFVARKNMGIHYNKKLPDINNNRKPYKPVPKKEDEDKFLAPKFESFCSGFQEYLCEHLLLEWPEGIIWSDETKGIDIGWDFCSESTPEDGEWLRQLVDLYKYGYMDTLRSDRNTPANVDGFISNPHIDFSDAQIADITDNLCFDWGFLGSAHNDIKLIKDPKLLDDLQQYVPEKLWNKIIHFNEK